MHDLLQGRTLAITSPRREIFHFKTPHFAAEVHRLVRRRISNHSPNPRVNPQDHLRHPQVGHRRRQQASHSINSINAFNIIAAMNIVMNPIIITSGTTSRAHHPNPDEVFDSIPADSVSIKERTKRIDGITMAAQTPICASKSIPQVTVGRNPRASSY